tara:strand:- start:19 stop:2382 length:2364 start_codon:yes stop_codon:yes gene_type:complete
MAETLLSPGVLARENDQSFITQQPAEIGAAIIGPSALGPVEVPTLVTSFSEYSAIFGTTVQSASVAYSYLTSLSANNYFQSGGSSLLVTRVTPENFTSATSSFMSTVDGSGLLTGDTNAAALFTSVAVAGTSFTGSGIEIYAAPQTYTQTGTGTGATFALQTNNGVLTGVTASAAGNGYEVGDTITFSSNDVGGSPLVTTELTGSSTLGFAGGNDAGSFTITQGATAATQAIVSGTNSTGVTGVTFTLTTAGGDGSAAITTITATSVGEGVKVGTIFTISAAAIISAIGAGGGTGNTVITVTALDLVADTAELKIVESNLVDLNQPFVLETISEGEVMNTGVQELSEGALATGSAQNVRWSIAGVNTGSGTFSLIVRRGNDNANQQTVLEQYSNVSLDPYQPNYIAAQIGDISKRLVNEGADYFVQESGSYANLSRYVRVKSVNMKTPNYFDNNGQAKSQFTGSLPAVQSGSFNGAVGKNIVDGRVANFYGDIGNGAAFDTQGLTGSNYNNAIALLGNIDEYQYNVISAPGLLNATHATQTTALINNSINRGDNIAVLDLVKYGSSVASVSQAASAFDNSYAATYWPWVQMIDPQTGELVYCPASTVIPGVYVFTDASSEPWFAPAGLTRGALGQVVRAERKLTANNRDTLYEANVNPLATFPQAGVVVFGQKTLQKRSSALDRVNVRRLLIALKGFISGVSDNLVFEQNTIATRNNFLSVVNPYLEGVQQRQGLYAFKVVMDDTNNTPTVIDRNELVGQIFLQPTKTAEFVILDFNVLPTGATFPA